LPYGKITGVSAVDRLNIIAHDKFQEIVDEANRADSPLKLQKVYLDNESGSKKTKTVISTPNVNKKFISHTDDKDETDNTEPMYQKPAEQKFAQKVRESIQNHQKAPSSEYLLQKETLESIVSEAKQNYMIEQSDLPNIEDEPDNHKIAEEVARETIAGIIDIPQIILVPKGSSNIGYSQFTLNCDSIKYQPVERDLLIQRLNDNAREILSKNKTEETDVRLEDSLIQILQEFDDISYDEYNDILYNLCAQLINHIKGYLKNDKDVRNVVLYNQRQLANFIYGEMQKNRNDSVSDFEVKITKGFSTLKEIAFTADANTKPINYRETKFDKSKIGQIIFNGFSKCLYTTVKFDSDTERRFSVILEQESIKWFKPAQGQFQIYYQNGTDSSEYVPDFVSETKDTIFMIETKAKNQINAEEVKAKKKAAQVWCSHASEHNAKNGGKLWKYLLIPHEEVKDNMTLKNFEQNYLN